MVFKTAEVSAIAFRDPVYGEYDYRPLIKECKKKTHRFGLFMPLVVDEERCLISGQCRYLATGELGWLVVDVRIVETSSDQLRAFKEQVREAIALGPQDRDALTVITVAEHHWSMCELFGSNEEIPEQLEWADHNRYKTKNAIRPQPFQGLDDT